jgi:hypothetical protein
MSARRPFHDPDPLADAARGASPVRTLVARRSPGLECPPGGQPEKPHGLRPGPTQGCWGPAITSRYAGQEHLTKPGYRLERPRIAGFVSRLRTGGRADLWPRTQTAPRLATAAHPTLGACRALGVLSASQAAVRSRPRAPAAPGHAPSPVRGGRIDSPGVRHGRRVARPRPRADSHFERTNRTCLVMHNYPSLCGQCRRVNAMFPCLVCRPLQRATACGHGPARAEAMARHGDLP